MKIKLISDLRTLTKPHQREVFQIFRRMKGRPCQFSMHNAVIIALQKMGFIESIEKKDCYYQTYTLKEGIVELLNENPFF